MEVKKKNAALARGDYSMSGTFILSNSLIEVDEIQILLFIVAIVGFVIVSKLIRRVNIHV